MTQEETDRIFDAITSNGCREMDEVRFHQAVNEALKLIQEKKKQNETDKIVTSIDMINQLVENDRLDLEVGVGVIASMMGYMYEKGLCKKL